MIVVFLKLVASPVPSLKMLGLGLATAIFVDATIVRMVLVPATMALLGKANWWLPAWLDRVLPHLTIKGAAHDGAAPEAATRRRFGGVPDAEEASVADLDPRFRRPPASPPGADGRPPVVRCWAPCRTRTVPGVGIPAPGPSRGSQPEADSRVGWGFVAMYAGAYLGTSLVFIAPLLVTLALKINSLVGTDAAPKSLALVAGVGSLLAIFANPFFGRRTATGRPRRSGCVGRG